MIESLFQRQEEEKDNSDTIRAIYLKAIIDTVNKVGTDIVGKLEDGLSVENLDDVNATLINELRRTTRAIVSALDKVGSESGEQTKKILDELNRDVVKRVFVENAKEFPQEISVSNLTSLSSYFDSLAEALKEKLNIGIILPQNYGQIPAPIVNVPETVVNVPAPIVNVPETVVNIPPNDPIDLSALIKALDLNLNKLRTNSSTRPLAVRLSDGQDWVDRLRTIAETNREVAQVLSDVTYLKDANGGRINPATDESLAGVKVPTGTGANGTIELTSANTWYAVPSSAPSANYVLVVATENAAGTIRWGYDNTGTPSATNGLQAPGQLTIRMAGGQVIYYASSTAGDDVNYTTKVI